MRSLMLCGLIALLPVAAQDDSWKTEIDNSLVRATRRLVAPHETVSAAEFPPALLVFLTDHSVRVTGAAPQDELRGKSGQFLWHPGGRIGLENLSDHRMELVQVTPKFSPAPEDLSAALGRRNVVFENDLIHVKHIHWRAQRAAFPTVDHVLPAVAIHLTAAHIKFTHADGRVDEFRMKAGDMRFEAAGYFSGVTAERLGDPHEVLRIQLKTREAKP